MKNTGQFTSGQETELSTAGMFELHGGCGVIPNAIPGSAAGCPPVSTCSPTAATGVPGDTGHSKYFPAVKLAFSC
uniref:Uncharacterized protein n=1 Tax=Taeniopygia guttata TaxID=59729 RepID=A0A674HID8_TAEGU